MAVRGERRALGVTAASGDGSPGGSVGVSVGGGAGSNGAIKTRTLALSASSRIIHPPTHTIRTQSNTKELPAKAKALLKHRNSSSRARAPTTHTLSSRHTGPEALSPLGARRSAPARGGGPGGGPRGNKGATRARAFRRDAGRVASSAPASASAPLSLPRASAPASFLGWRQPRQLGAATRQKHRQQH